MDINFINKNKKTALFVFIFIIITSSAVLSYNISKLNKKFPFYIYNSFGNPKKFHYFASGRMGDVNAIRIWGNCKENPYTGKSCIKVVYDVSDKNKNREGWAGIYWMYPPNNWGIVPNGGYDLNGAKKCIFHARGEKGGEKITFKIGGIPGKYGDSTEVFLSNITLTTEWQKYEIDLRGKNLSRIVGGFCLILTKANNPNGAVFYLDEIYYDE